MRAVCSVLLAAMLAGPTAGTAANGSPTGGVLAAGKLLQLTQHLTPERPTVFVFLLPDGTAIYAFHDRMADAYGLDYLPDRWQPPHLRTSDRNPALPMSPGKSKLYSVKLRAKRA